MRPFIFRMHSMKLQRTIVIGAAGLALILAGCTSVLSPFKPHKKEIKEMPSPPPPVVMPVPTAIAPVPPPVEAKKPKILVRIGDEKITRPEFEKRYNEYLLIANPEKERILTRDEFLQKLIRDELVMRYAKKGRIDKDPPFRALLAREKQKLLVQYILQNKLPEKLNVSDAEVNAYYKKHINEFTHPKKIQVRHILTSTIEEAREALLRLNIGGNFGEVAQDMSIHSSRNQGGQLPPFSRGTYNRTFEDAAFSLKVGQRSGIVKTDLGYHIIEKTGETPERIIPLAQVKDKIMERTIQEKRKNALDAFYGKLRTETPVEILRKP